MSRLKAPLFKTACQSVNMVIFDPQQSVIYRIISSWIGYSTSPAFHTGLVELACMISMPRLQSALFL